MCSSLRFFVDGSCAASALRQLAESFGGRLQQEILQHKWLLSEEAKRDLGNQAITHWFKNYWWKFCRGRRLEHLEGEKCWREFRDSEFAVLLRVAMEREPLNQILDRMKGKETPIHDNLEIMMWALGESGISMQRVQEFLLLIDIDCARLPIPNDWNYVFAA